MIKLQLQIDIDFNKVTKPGSIRLSNRTNLKTVMKGIFTSLLFLCTTLTLISCKSHTYIDAYMQELAQKGKFNGNVLVVKNGKTIYENSFGFSDGSKTTKLTNAYRFDLGSVYKEFPAVAIM